MKTFLIIWSILLSLGLGFYLGQATFEPQVVTKIVTEIKYVPKETIKEIIYETILQPQFIFIDPPDAVLPKTYPNITPEQAIKMLEEGRDSHLIFKAALEAGLEQPTKWTGGVEFQTYVIEKYNKLIDFIKWLTEQ